MRDPIVPPRQPDKPDTLNNESPEPSKKPRSPEAARDLFADQLARVLLSMVREQRGESHDDLL